MGQASSDCRLAGRARREEYPDDVLFLNINGEQTETDLGHGYGDPTAGWPDYYGYDYEQLE
jgi:hypothetical protein